MIWETLFQILRKTNITDVTKEYPGVCISTLVYPDTKIRLKEKKVRLGESFGLKGKEVPWWDCLTQCVVSLGAFQESCGGLGVLRRY